MKKDTVGQIIYKNLIDFMAFIILISIFILHCDVGFSFYKIYLRTLILFWELISFKIWTISPYFFATILVILAVTALISLLFGWIIRGFILNFWPKINKKRTLIVLTIWLFWFLIGCIFSITA